MKRIFLYLLILLVCLSANAGNVRGKVLVDGKPREGIVVSDGVVVATTKSDGSYTLNSKGRQHVFVSVPGDCKIPLANGRPAFYKEIDYSVGEPIEISFNLEASDTKNWTLLALADVQIGLKQDYTDLRDSVMPVFVDSIGAYTGTVYAISLGDVVWNKPEYYGLYNEQMARINIPVFSVIGNHDHNELTKGDIYSDAEYRDNMGPTYYSVNIGDCHLVALDNIIYTGRSGRGDYECNLTDAQLDWLKKDLKHVSKDKTIIIGMHAPSARRYNGHRMKSADRLYKLVSGFNDVQILTGHMHWNFTTPIADNITDTTFGAVNGAFWYPICNDGSPQGYGVLRFEGNKLVDKYYKGFREPKSYQIKIYAPEEAVLGFWKADPDATFDKVAINIWGWDPKWNIEVSEDNENWTLLDPVASRPGRHYCDPSLLPLLTGEKNTFPANHGGSRPTYQNDHIFFYTPSEAGANVYVKASDPFGNVYTEQLYK